MYQQSGGRGRIGPFARRLARALERSPADLALAALCWLMLAAASLLILLVPSRVILRRLGGSRGAVSCAPPLDIRQRERAQRIARALATAARHAPFRADCYPQALVAAHLCRRSAIPHAVQLGARFAAVGHDRQGKLEGHAWVCCEGLTICGGATSGLDFATVACFVYSPRRPGRDVID